MGMDVASLLSHLREHPGEAAPLIHLHR
jgi:hypothetical protein